MINSIPVMLLIDWTYARVTSTMDTDQRAEFEDALDGVRHAEERAKQERAERIALVQTMMMNSQGS